MRRIVDKYGLAAIVCLAIVLRVVKIRYAFFASVNELARDLIVNFNFVFEKQFPLLGPSASLGGFNFGAFYYYLMAPFLWLSNYYAWGAVALSAFFSVLSVILVYFLLKSWFADKSIALIGAFLSAVAVLDIQNAYYVSNPNLLPFFTLLFFYCLTNVIRGQRVALNSIISGLAVISSTDGYCQEIFFEQYRHLPFRARKLNKGTKSTAASS